MSKTKKFFRTRTWRVERWTLEMFWHTLGRFQGTLMMLRTKRPQTHQLSKQPRSHRMRQKNKIIRQNQRLKLMQGLHLMPQQNQKLQLMQGPHLMPWLLKRQR